MYGASAAEIWEIFGDHVEGNPAALALALSSAPLGDIARNALEKSFESFGYGAMPCAFATLAPRVGDGPSLDPQALFMLVEGLDPVCVVCTDAEAVHAVESAYRTTCPLDAPARVFGRSAATFRNLDTLLETPEGKQKAWSVLKTLPYA